MMRKGCSALVKVGVALVVLLGCSRRAIAGDEPCAAGASAVVQLSTAPLSIVTASFLAADGTHVDAVFDPALEEGLVRRVELRKDLCYSLAISSDRFVVPDPGQPGVVLTIVYGYAPTKLVAGASTNVPLVPRVLGDANRASNAETIQVTVRLAPERERARAPQGVRRSFPIEDIRSEADERSAGGVPDAVVEVLQLLGELALDKAKAEAMRLFKDKLVKRLCAELKLSLIDGTSQGALLPATCGQLRNLRLGDLGGSAEGLLTVLREDLSYVVVPKLAERLVTVGAGGAQDGAPLLEPKLVTLIGALLARAASERLTVDELRMALVALFEEKACSDLEDQARTKRWLCTVVDVAVDCLAPQRCATDTVMAKLQAAGVVSPEAAAAVLRMRRVLQSDVTLPARQRAVELIAIILGYVRDAECRDARCAARVAALQNLAVGAIEGDYLRSLGGVTTFVESLCKDSKAFTLLASVLSYVDTYRQTEGEDPKLAREQRKKALEALIEAGTNRAGRDGEWISSLGTLAGYQAGYRKIGDVDFDSSQDLRLLLGISALKVPADHQPTFFANLAIADLGLLVASSAQDGLEPELQWSDFLEVSGQLGVAYGKNLPLVLGLSAGWAPGVRYQGETGGTQRERGVARIGVFLGIHVPFFDLN